MEVSQKQDMGDGQRSDSIAKRLPVTIITGFLGAGKTTLVEHILNNKDSGLRVVVVNNEMVPSRVASVGTSNEFKSETARAKAVALADVFETQGGCICCGGGEDFRMVFAEISRNKERVDHVLLETTGMADPAFTSAFFLESLLAENFYLDSIVCVADAKHTAERINVHQSDLKKEGEGEGVKLMNECIDQIIIADRIILNKTDLLGDEKALEALKSRISSLNPHAAIRTTLYSNVDDVGWVVGAKSFDLQTLTTRKPDYLKPTESDGFPPQSGMGGKHSGLVGSVCLVARDPLPLDATKQWLTTLLKHKGVDIYRSKGVVSAEGSPHRYVFQGVHEELLDFSTRGLWGPTTPRSNFIFIGKSLNGEEILKSFNSTLNPEGKIKVLLVKNDMGGAPLGRQHVFGGLFILALIIYHNFPSDVFTSTTYSSFNLAILFVLFIAFAISLRFFRKGKAAN